MQAKWVTTEEFRSLALKFANTIHRRTVCAQVFLDRGGCLGEVSNKRKCIQCSVSSALLHYVLFHLQRRIKHFLLPFKILFCGDAWKSIDSRPRTAALLTLLISAASCSHHLLICVLRKVWSRDYVYKTQQSMVLICGQVLLCNSLLITWSSLSTVLCGICPQELAHHFPST